MIRALILSFVTLSPALAGAQLPGAPTVDYNKHVRPIFSKHCFECHSEGKKKEKAGFVFDNVKRLANSIGPGEIIVPKDTSASDLMEIVTLPDGKRAMPPEGKDKLSSKEVQTLRTWIEEGANLPGIDIAAKIASERRSGPKQLMNWTNAKGKKLRATYEGMEGGTVLLKAEDGQVYKVPLETLSAGSKIQAQLQAEKE
jgi:mono/diheme cytochrome c family protein